MPQPVSNRADELPKCSLTVDEFAKSVVESGLLDGEEVRSFRLDHPTEETQALARRLVSKKKLTHFQACELLEESDQPLLLDRYIILDKIGSGGMGAVYKALHRQMDRIVALKILPQTAVDSPDKVKRFHREVRAAAKLQHQNIVIAHDASQLNDIHYLVMEYVQGYDLSQLLRKHGPLPVATAINYILQAARGLQHAHYKGIVHRDIKPANMLLDQQGTVKILDMGLARIDDLDSDKTQTESQDLTQAGMVMGTVAYLAPEQALDAHSADARSDIYSLGCTFHFLLTGKAVYSKESAINTIMAHREAAIPTLSGLGDEIDSAFRKMVAKRPEDRFQSMTDLISALEALDVKDENKTVVTQQIALDSETIFESKACVDTSKIGVDKIDIEIVPRKPKPKPKRPFAVRRWGLMAAGLLGVIGLVWVAGIFIAVETPQGTIIIEIDQPELAGAVVSIDGKNKITLTTGEDSEPIEIEADEKTHTLKVTKGGFEAFVKEFTVEAGGQQRIRVHLQPALVTLEEFNNPRTSAGATLGGNWALEFEGKGRVGTPVVVDGTQPFTFEAHFAPTSFPETQLPCYVLGHGGYGLRLQPESLGASFDFYHTGTGSSSTVIAGATPAILGRRIHTAGVWDGREMTLWIDGKRQLKVGHIAQPRKIDHTMSIGGFSSKGGGFYHGVIDEVRISDIARYTKTFTPAQRFATDKNTLALYHFDSGVGDVLVDSSGNGRDGQIVGAKWVRVDDELKVIGGPRAPLATTGDADRRAALWAFEIGATHIEITSEKQNRSIISKDDLPSLPFVVTGIFFDKPVDFRGANCDILSELKSLERLTLGGLLDLNVVLQVSRIQSLRFFFIHHSNTTDDMLRQLAGLKQLRYLTIHSSNLTDKSIDFICENFKELEHLGLHENLIKGSSLHKVRSLAKLQSIDLRQTQVDDEALKGLKGIGLQRVHLGEGVTDASIATLSSMQELVSLELSATSMTAEGVQALQKALPNCKITHESIPD